MAQYIDKSALVAEIENTRKHYIERDDFDNGWNFALDKILSFIDTLEIKEDELSIYNIDDILKKEGLDPYSKEAKNLKESYYMALEKLKAQKGE